MEIQPFFLSSAGLKNIVIDYQKDDEFRFIIGNNEIKMQKIIAEFLSPRVSHLHHIDPTINYIDFNDLLKQSKQISFLDNIINDNTTSTIRQLAQGESINVNANNQRDLRFLSILLGNEELYHKLETKKSQEKTKDEMLDEIVLYYQLFEISEYFFESDFNEMIDDFSSHMSLEDIEKLKKLPKKLFYIILKNDHFVSNDEDSLMNTINEFISIIRSEKTNEKINEIELYEKVDFSKLSSQKFREFLSNFDFNLMTAKLWNNLCQCFFTKHSDQVDDKNEVKIEFDGNPSNRFSGIISYLRGNKKINVSDEGIISVTASSTRQSFYPKYAVEFDSDQYYHSNNSKDWLQYDFKDKKIRPTQYSIRTSNDHDRQHPVNWCIEVSNTARENEWKMIDSRSNVTSLSQRNKSETFEIKEKLEPNESYRYVRFRVTGDTSRECGCVVIFSLEYFGTLKKDNIK